MNIPSPHLRMRGAGTRRVPLGRYFFLVRDVSIAVE
jgi:hypothetical protein